MKIEVGYITVNCPSVRKQLIDAGIHLCGCCSFPDAVWLTYGYTDMVHGLGYSDETMPMTVEQVCNKFLKEEPNAICFDYKVAEFIKFIKHIEKNEFHK